MQSQAKNTLLNNGTQLPLIGLGTSRLKNKEDMTNLLRTALDIGYRHFDTAIHYQNEEMIGESLQQIFSEGKYKREDIYLVSKIFPFKTMNTIEMVERSLKNLQVDYIDLYYLHCPMVAPSQDLLEWNHKPVHVIWAELEEVYRKGYVKSIGVSNFNVQSLVDLLSYAKVKPVSNQVELHVFLQQQRLVDFCKKATIHVTAYCPLARYHEIIQNTTLQDVADRHNAPISQILLAFLLEQDISIIPKTEKLSRLQENYDSVKIKLTEEDMKDLRSLDKNYRAVDPTQRENLGYIPIFD